MDTGKEGVIIAQDFKATPRAMRPVRYATPKPLPLQGMEGGAVRVRAKAQH